MINSQMLFDVFNYNHFSLQEVADILDISLQDLKDRLDRGVMQTNEVEMLLHFLRFPCNPMKIFFDTYDYEDPKKIEWEDIIRKADGGKIAMNNVIHRP